MSLKRFHEKSSQHFGENLNEAICTLQEFNLKSFFNDLTQSAETDLIGPSDLVNLPQKMRFI